MREIKEQGSTLIDWLKRNSIFIVFLALCPILVLGGCGREDGSWERMQQAGTLRIGVDPTFPPFALADGENVAGIDIERGRALAAELMLDPQFVYFGYDGLYDALTTGQVDVLISALVLMPERTKDVAYTNPYFDAGLILVVPGDTLNIQGMEDLNNRIVSVELGALGHVEALEWQRKMNGLTVQTHSDSEEALKAVVDGRADAALVDSISGRLYLRDLPAGENMLTILPEPVYSEPYALAVRIDERELLERLNGALAEIVRDGTLDDIIADHLGP